MRPPRDGDFYIDNSSQDFWLHENGAWVLKGSIKPDVDTGSLINIQPIIAEGFVLGVQVDRIRFLGSIADALGISMAAAVTRFNMLSATTHGMGFALACTISLSNLMSLSAAMSEGFGMAATIDRSRFLSVLPAYGYSQASTLSLTTPVAGFLAVAGAVSPFLTIYNSSYATILLPGATPATAVKFVSFSHSKRYLAFCTATVLFVYDMSTSPPTNITNVVSPPAWASLIGLTWNSDDTKLAVIDQTVSPYCWVYNTSTWASVTAPIITAGPICIDWSPSGDRIGIGGSDLTFTFKEFDGSTMAGVTAPATVPTFGVRGIGYSPNGTHLALHGTDAQNIFLYNRTGMVLLTDPATLPGNGPIGAQNLSWTQDGLKLALNGGPFLVYNRSGDTFTNDTLASTPPAVAGHSVAFNRSGDKLLVSLNQASPNLYKYDVAGNYTLDPTIPQPAFTVLCLDSSI